jgi:DUF1016 N-terminal domain
MLSRSVRVFYRHYQVEEIRRVEVKWADLNEVASSCCRGLPNGERGQSGSPRAEYGDRMIKRLAEDLTKRFGHGFSRSNLLQMRQFFLTPAEVQTPSGLSEPESKALPSFLNGGS